MSSGAGYGVGADFSPAMLAGAKEKSTICKRLVQADCRFLAFADATFDIVICSFAVGHIREVQCAAREVARVAAPGSDVYVSELHPQAYEAGWRAGFRDRRGAVEITSWSRSVDEFAAPWISAGFECVRVVECRFGEAEQKVFAVSGKGHLFEEFCKIPAVLICQFQNSARRWILK
jgi:ubiquinone/menaquinone biosynthesis C-methylase UbiE